MNKADPSTIVFLAVHAACFGGVFVGTHPHPVLTGCGIALLTAAAACAIFLLYVFRKRPGQEKADSATFHDNDTHEKTPPIDHNGPEGS